MAAGTCPECGMAADQHSSEPRFWVRPGGCDLLPAGVTSRVAQYEHDAKAAS